MFGVMRQRFASRLAACLFVCATALSGGPAPAFGQPSVREAFEAGDWTHARTLAGEADDAISLTYAAEAALAPLVLGELIEADRLEKRRRARAAAALAREALARDPDYPRAHLALAAALGYEGRYTNALHAALAQLPQRSRAHMGRALGLTPAGPWGNALLGAWHLEIVRRAGERTFGASSRDGLEHYRAAVAVADSPAIPYHFAIALLAHDAEAYGEEALRALRSAAAMETATAFDTAMRRRSEALLEIATTFRSAAAEEAVRRLEE